jgi:chaperonin GroES
MTISFKKLQAADNIAEMLDGRELQKIGSSAVRGCEIDEESRSEWKAIVEKAMKIAKQVMEKKSFPWDGASNIKFPLIAKACIDYASRTVPEIIQNDRVVKSMVVGTDVDGQKQLRADRVSRAMSYQLLIKSPDWEDGTDMLLQTLPVLGTVFKKTYYDEIEKMCVSELCTPDHIVVNYDVKSLDAARRVTHILTMYENDILERQAAKLYVDIEMDKLSAADTSNAEDEDPAHEVLEQHCWLDLDGDGYKEPYIVTVHKSSGMVLRIVNRFKSVEKKNGKIFRIVPQKYFTDFHFIRSPDGGFYSMGFGSLLLPLNSSINSLINMLMDAGTLSTIQSGFYSSRLRLKAGDMRFKMGEFQKVDAPSGERLADSFHSLPFKEPSQTLYQLLGLLIQIGNDLSSTTDVLQGKQPAQNVASSTISQLVEQGTKVFTAINRRVYRSLKKEYRKIYDLNYEYLDQAEYAKILDDPAANVKTDFEPDTLDILPVADPTISSETQRLQKATMIQQLRSVDVREADKMLLEGMQFDPAMIDRLIPAPDPNAPPPPEAQKVMAEISQIQANIAKISAEATLSAEKSAIDKAKLQIEMQTADAQINYYIGLVWKMQQDVLATRQKLQTTAGKMQFEEQIKGMNTHSKVSKEQHDNVMSEVEFAHKRQKELSELEIKAAEIAIKTRPVKEDE